MPGGRAGDRSLGCTREREITNESTCKHGYSSQCDEIWCQNAPTKTSGVHLNIIKCFKGYNIGFYSWWVALKNI